MGGSIALVTGGAGFIGSHLVEALLARGRRVRVLDNLSTGRRESLPEHPDLDVVVGDLRAPDTLGQAVDGVDVVFHEGALLSVPGSVEDPLAYHEVNVSGTLALLLAARAAGVRRLVFASSSAVYGDQPVFPLHEDLPERPISPYGAAKLIGEHYCANFYRHYGLETVSLRYFNVFGPRQDPASEYAAVVARFIDGALAGRALEIHGDGRQTRDFTYVGNVVHANLLAAEAPAAAGKVFNVASGQRLSVADIVRELEALLDCQIATRHTPPRRGDVRDTLADIARARESLGYAPVVSFREGLRRTVEAASASLGSTVREPVTPVAA